MLPDRAATRLLEQRKANIAIDFDVIFRLEAAYAHAKRLFKLIDERIEHEHEVELVRICE